MEKIISGGQTGVDRAALDVALELGLPCGGWCPKGRRAEDGKIPGRYPLEETSSAEYPVRTQLNVEDSDGTLILSWGSPTGGTALTIKLARRLKKPYLLIDLSRGEDPQKVRVVQQESNSCLECSGTPRGRSPGDLPPGINLPPRGSRGGLTRHLLKISSEFREKEKTGYAAV
jgi:hypothetical protein